MTNILCNHIPFYSPAGTEPQPFRSMFDHQVGFIDFEVAAAFSPGDDLRIMHAAEESRSHAPETLSNKHYSPFLSDIFSLGQHLKNELEHTHQVGLLALIDQTY